MYLETLGEWCRRNGILPTTPTTETGAVSLTVAVDHADRRALSALSDYEYDHSNGPVVWFLPRKPRPSDE